MGHSGTDWGIYDVIQAMEDLPLRFPIGNRQSAIPTLLIFISHFNIPPNWTYNKLASGSF